MEKRLTQLISFVFHPVFAPLYGVFLIFQSNIYITYTLGFFAKAIIYGTLAVNCVLFPVLCIYFLYRKKFISDIYLSKQEERFFPLLFIASFYLFTYYLLFKIHVPAIISSFIFSGFVSSCLLILLNFKWKISMHTTAIGALIGLLFLMSRIFMTDVFWLMAIVIFIGGLVGYARLYSNQHSAGEVYTGYLIGFISEILSVIILAT
jgi:membrane-associated phospholipid phosphatase